MIEKNKLPRHVAIIMDGNGRWAKERGFSRNEGHKKGSEVVKKITNYAEKLGIEYLTVYAFSTENWKRPQDEVDGLMNLLRRYLKNHIKDTKKNNAKFRVIGDRIGLPQDIQNQIEELEGLTKDKSGICINIAINYGGRDEIVRAVKNIINDVEDGKLNKENITQDIFSNYLYTNESPDPDLIIRPSGEQRISNFLLWQCAYSEFWYSNVNWPDFSEHDLQKAIYDYQNRDRRFGGV